MIELFSRIPDGLHLQEDIRLTPIHVSDGISSLSAILLDDDHYCFLKAGSEIVDGLPILKADYIVPFKMKAWLDLTERKNNGQPIDSKDIKKHRNDVFRLVLLLNTANTVEVPASIRTDIGAFLENMKKETINPKSLGIQNRSFESIIELYSNLYRCTHT